MKPHWQLKKLLYVHLSLLLALILCFIPLTWSWIHGLDIKAAYFFNSFILHDPFWQKFWNFLKSSTMDWCYDGVILLFALYYIFTKERHYKRKILQCLLLVGFTIACFKPIHRGPIHDHFRPTRMSPRGELSDLVSISMVIPGKKVHPPSNGSYPSDHGYTIFMFVLSCFFLRGWRFGLTAALVSSILMVSRIVTATHWLTDIFLGSLPIALFNLSWLFYSPAFAFFSNLFDQRLLKSPCLKENSPL